MRASGHFLRAPDQVASARAFVHDTLAAWGLASAADTVVLIASELFTNAVLHGAGDVDVILALADGQLRLEVVDDGGPTEPRQTERPSIHAVSGRGLTIVDALADTWGNGRDAQGRTRVWAEMSPA